MKLNMKLKLKDIAEIRVCKNKDKALKGEILLLAAGDNAGELELLKEDRDVNQFWLVINSKDESVITNKKLFNELATLNLWNLVQGCTVRRIMIKSLAELEIEV